MTEDSTINLQEIIKNLLEDLKNEWTHMRFYLYHASAVTGLHRHESRLALNKTRREKPERR